MEALSKTTSWHPLLCTALASLGFSLQWVWVYTVLAAVNRGLFSSMEGLFDQSAFMMAHFGGVICAVVLTCDMLKLPIGVAKGRGYALTGGLLRLVPAACFSIGGFSWFGNASVPLGAAVLLGGLAGAGSCLLLVFSWLPLFGEMGGRRTSLCVVLSFPLALMLATVFWHVSLKGQLTIAALCIPVVEVVCYMVANDLICATQTEERPPAPERPARQISGAFILKLCLLMALLGFVVSVLRELVIHDGVMDALPLGTSVALLALVAGALVCIRLCALRFAARMSGETPLLIALFGVAFVVAALLLFPAVNGPLRMVAEVLAYVGLEGALVVSFALLYRGHRQRSIELMGPGIAALFLGQMVCPLLNSFSSLGSSEISIDRVVEPIALMLVLLVAVYLVASGRASGEHVQGGEAGPQAPALSLNECGSRVAVESFKLSAREGEVLALVCKGHGVASIGEKLAVSENTVKTYMHRIFSKTGTHSRQELVDLVEEIEDDGFR